MQPARVVFPSGDGKEFDRVVLVEGRFWGPFSVSNRKSHPTNEAGAYSAWASHGHTLSCPLSVLMTPWSWRH